VSYREKNIELRADSGLPGFEYQRINTAGATINVAAGGSGIPLLLLHGYPETHRMWDKVAPALAEEFFVVCADLRGYGDSSKPEGSADHSNYSKRAMATDMVEVMAVSDAMVAEYLRTFGTPEGIHATCEDYRAGATVDLANDRADVAAGRKIACPTLILWGGRSVVGKMFRPLETWRDLVTSPMGEAIDCGHFIPEEKPDETASALLGFFRA
jgi:pimeloyl-ACP methyl ester carboxylesterase